MVLDSSMVITPSLGNLLHCICNQLSYSLIPGMKQSLLLRSAPCRLPCWLILHGSASTAVSVAFLHTLSQNDRVRTCCQVLHSFIDHCLCQYGSCRGTVTSDIIGLRSNFLDQAVHPCSQMRRSSSISFAIVTPSFVISGAPYGLIQNNVSSFRSEGYTNGICQFIYASLQRLLLLLRQI